MRKKTKMICIFGVLPIVFLGLLFSCSSEDASHSKKPSGQAAGADHAAGANYLTGRVVQTMDSGGYTYILLNRDGSQLWVAMPVAKVSVGADIILEPGIEMKNFTSNTLKRTFDRIIFSSGPVSGEIPAQNFSAAKNSAPHTIIEKKNITVGKAKGPDSYTISEIYGAKTALDGKHVTVKGVVVKVSTGIMGKNWIHLQDGSGSQEKVDFDLTVTSQDQPAAGDVVVASGVLRADKDFGAGYRYVAIMEDARIQKDQKN
jgi:hypothetical protein